MTHPSVKQLLEELGKAELEAATYLRSKGWKLNGVDIHIGGSLGWYHPQAGWGVLPYSLVTALEHQQRTNDMEVHDELPQITAHRCGVGMNEKIQIHHRKRNQDDPAPTTFSVNRGLDLIAGFHFQSGNPNDPDIGINGITNEVLLAVVQTRLEEFQKSPFACQENYEALTHIGAALHWLHKRTIEREKRGVEGQRTT